MIIYSFKVFNILIIIFIREGLTSYLGNVDPDKVNAMMRAAESEMDNKEADEIEYKNLFMEVSLC